VASDVASTLVRLGQSDMVPLGWSRDGTELLFVRGVGDEQFELFPKDNLFILHADGSETRLNADPISFGGAAISADGSRVVFAAWGDDLGLYVVDAEGGRPVRLPLPRAEGIVADPAISPDGTRIAFVDSGESENHVWVMDVDGGNAREILANEHTVVGGVGSLQWSPAGDRILGVARSSEGTNSVYTFAPDGTDFTRVLTSALGPNWSPDGSQIAYTIECDLTDVSCGGLAIADADGSNVREFGYAASGPWHPGVSATEEPAPVETPTPDANDEPSPADGEVLVFTGTSEEAPGDLVAVNPATGDERAIVEDLDDVRRAAWSADRRWVAFETPGSLWVVDETLEPRRVVDEPWYWSWSPTGAELLVWRDGSTLSIIDPLTGLQTELTSTLDLSAPPAWSPDGTSFVFEAGAGTIDSIDARTGERSPLLRLPGVGVDVEAIAWSPDGSRLAILSDGEPAGLFVVDADGSDIRLLAEDESVFGFAWSPDGTRLIFTDEHGAVFVAPADGSTASLVASLPDGDATNPVWSPDGSQIAFSFEGGREVAVTFASDRALVIEADGSGAAEPIDDLTYASWNGGSFCSSCDWWNADPIEYRDPNGGGG
jgi:Tol biopolymer transport system component